MPFYNVSRTLTGGFPGFGLQDVVETKTVESSSPPAGGTLNLDATHATNFHFDADQTTLPTIAVDFYGSFPGV